MTDLIIPDLSEFQGAVDWRALVAGGYPAAIIRAHNGSRADYQWSTNRAGAHAAGVEALGIYQYLQAGRDATAQANALCDLIGSLRPGEWAICDLEEGSGDQSARAHAWYATVAGRLHDASSEELYSGDYFYGAHRLSAAGFSRIWLAAYSSVEPSAAHELWQFTDARHFPGVSGSNDASIFHGSIADLLSHINPLTPPEDIVTPQDKKDIAALVLAELPGVLANVPAAVWNYNLTRRDDAWKPDKTNPSLAAHWFVEGKDITDRQRAAEAVALEAKVDALAAQVAALVKLVTPLVPK